MAERCGFTVLAFEYGFSEGFPLGAWAQGEGPDDELAGLLATSIPVGVEEPLRWTRRHNASAAEPVRFAGIDIPAAGGSLLPCHRHAHAARSPLPLVRPRGSGLKLSGRGGEVQGKAKAGCGQQRGDVVPPTSRPLNE
ncbi:erythromycin esterase family protein [Nonomuraea sp. NPDC048892]|uniref:erythromycin esterase family protein n=1 Tax=Nonomuraea sp. NPDC048892 TaxID=3154624 RepID=UPI0033FF012C